MTDIIDFSDWKEKRTNAHGLTLKLSDGTVMIIPAPLLWPTQLQDLDRVDDKGNPDPYFEDDDDYLVRILMTTGLTKANATKVMKRFVDDGGNYAVINTMLSDRAGLPVPE